MLEGLRFLRGRALPGVEIVDEAAYRRVVAPVVQGATPGWLRVSAWGEEPALRLEVNGIAPLQLHSVVTEGKLPGLREYPPLRVMLNYF